MAGYDLSDPFSADGDDADPLSYAVMARDSKVLDMVSRAVDAKETLLAFQPVVTSIPNADGQRPVAYYEGLIRILDSTGRIIPAKQFIASIEERELGRTIDCLALEHGLMALAEDRSLRLAINMSARSIGYPNWRRILERGLDAGPELGERLILEITEGSAMMMPEIVTTFMSDLQDMGVAFAIDDFGSGYTSFRYLRDFYFDILKIDKQFIRGVHQNRDNLVLTEALVAIARQFEMFTVAEGVESQEDASLLQSVGIDCLQGYYTGAPRTISPIRARAALRDRA